MTTCLARVAIDANSAAQALDQDWDPLVTDYLQLGARRLPYNLNPMQTRVRTRRLRPVLSSVAGASLPPP